MPLTTPFDVIECSTTVYYSSMRPQQVELSVRNKPAIRGASQLVPIDNPHIDLRDGRISAKQMCRETVSFPRSEIFLHLVKRIMDLMHSARVLF